ncbi:MAG: AbrB family transcriptional regulator [Yoonia sp.]|nr:AbrB family transcriptional regulator [Yoonia sp.]
MALRSSLIAQFWSLIIGVVSGLAAYTAGLPLPWMLGAMLGNMAFALIGAPIAGPTKLRPYVIPVLGVMLGSAITADIFSQLSGWALTVVILPIYLAVAAGMSFWIYRRVGGYDHVTAYYSAMPGGLNEMLILGGEAGGDERKIALAHAARVLLVILFVALFFGLFLGVRSGANGRNWIPLNAPASLDYVYLFGAAVIGSWLGKLARLPASAVFGPMIVSGILHALKFVEIAPPSVFVIASQIVIGAIIGTRFIGATWRELRRDLGLAVLGTGVMLIVAVCFGASIAWASHMSMSQAFLAFAPGGLTEMSLLTLAMHQDVAYVSTIHIIRITMVVGVAAFVFGLLGRRIN